LPSGVIGRPNVQLSVRIIPFLDRSSVLPGGDESLLLVLLPPGTAVSLQRIVFCLLMFEA
jgi:hypothetical protein